ncbi:hypothetical protein NQZ68_018063, partial [Dissostichus eleginoides]
RRFVLVSLLVSLIHANPFPRTKCKASAGDQQRGLVPGASLWDVVWGFSELQADEILRSSSFFQELRAGNLTQRCYTHFLQQEALYLTGVSSTLEALIGRLQEADETRSLLQETLKHYSSRNQKRADDVTGGEEERTGCSMRETDCGLNIVFAPPECTTCPPGTERSPVRPVKMTSEVS